MLSEIVRCRRFARSCRYPGAVDVSTRALGDSSSNGAPAGLGSPSHTSSAHQSGTATPDRFGVATCSCGPPLLAESRQFYSVDCDTESTTMGLGKGMPVEHRA